MGGKFRDPASWPRTGNRDLVDLGLRRWRESVRALPPGPDRDAAEEFARTGAGGAMLACVFGASPFLGGLAVRDPGTLAKLWRDGPERHVEGVLAELGSLAPDCSERDASRALRYARRKVALAVALADISGQWNVEAVTTALTDLAQTACSVAFRILLTRLAKRGAITPPHKDDPERESGLIALGLGKLGGHELNFSSDIDLILLYDPDVVPAARRYEVPGHLMRLARWFIALLSDPTEDGLAFRVDLRLRPDPVSTPLVLSTQSALRYYESRGQTWERAAMIKARPIAGDVAAGREYLRKLEPFVWRNHLDFATVQDLHDIKKRIDAQHRGGAIGEPGQNLKLGRGGIREIEFFAQTHQLVWGGANPSLREIPTCEALRSLTRAGHLGRRVTDTLSRSYRYLRRVEHRIQMVADKQTHSLPVDPADFRTLARFLGYAGSGEFRADLTEQLRQVERQYESFFELPREMTEASASSTLSTQSREETVASLGRMGFRKPGDAFGVIERWRTGSGLETADERARSLLQSLTPSLVIATCGTEDPDLAVRKFDELMRGSGDARRTLTLLQANLHVMETVAEILVTAPAIGAMLTERPALVEVLLDPATDAWSADSETLARSLDEKLQGAQDHDAEVELLGEWVDTARFRVGVRVLFHSLDPLDALQPLSDIADCGLLHRLQRVRESLAGADVALLASGRLARREVNFDGPLQLCLCPDDNESVPDESRLDGIGSGLARDLRGSSDQGRASLRIRIGPSRPLASLDRESPSSPMLPADLAVRRPIARSERLARRVRRRIRRAMAAAGEHSELGPALSALRNQWSRTERPAGPWSIETRPGGLLDLELLVHRLRLGRAATHPEVLAEGTTEQTLKLLGQSGDLTEAEVAELVDGWRVWTRILTLQNLVGSVTEGDSVPTSLRPLFRDAAGCQSFDEVESRMDAVAASVSASLERVLGSAPQSDRAFSPEG